MPKHFGGTPVLLQRKLAVAILNSKTHHQPTLYMRLKIGGRKGNITQSKAKPGIPVEARRNALKRQAGI